MSEHGVPREPGGATPGVEHEQRDISTRVVVIFGLSLVAGAIIVHFVIWLVFGYLGGVNTARYPRQFPMARVDTRQLPPEPRLQATPREDLKDLRADEEQYLHSYGWVDQGAGVVHIPIERAIELTLKQGLPARGEAPPEPGMPSESNSGRPAPAGK